MEVHGPVVAGRLMFRCKRCEARWEKPSVDVFADTAKATRTGLDGGPGISIHQPAIQFHTCEDGAAGYMEFIGIEGIDGPAIDLKDEG
jgi:hypothetical protein